jgi:hypothetical protein
VSSGATDFEALLREALSPVDPPEDLTARMEMALVSLTELAQDELEAWELKTMRDPRNWARPAAAVLIGAGAGTALVVLRVRAGISRPACVSSPSARSRISPKKRAGSSRTADPPQGRLRSSTPRPGGLRQAR